MSHKIKRLDGKDDGDFSPPAIAGNCFGIAIGPPRPDASNPLFQIFVEDDESWHATDLVADTHWLRDLRDVIDRAITVQSKQG